MKKIIMMAGLSLLSTVATANMVNKSGFNMGVQGGYVAYRMECKNNTESFGTIKGNGGIGGLFFGYTASINSHLFIGLEMYGQYQNAKVSDRESDDLYHYEADMTMKESYGGNLLLGTHYKNISPFIKIGYVNTKFELKNKNINIATNRIKDEEKFSKKFDGLLLGGGAYYTLNKNWSLGADYSYTLYKEQKFHQEHSNFAKPRVHLVNARLKYSF